MSGDDYTRIYRRRLPCGAEPMPEGGVHFRVWAPDRGEVGVVLEDTDQAPEYWRTVVLAPEGDGYFSGEVPDAGPGSLYRFRLDREGLTYPDPASRFQPRGPFGPSQVIDAGVFAWADHDWPGLVLQGQVLCEMHVGTFTEEGTWQGAVERLPALVETGITAVEVMPVADFAGRFDWGYGGVNFFAPAHRYGRPDDMRAFVNEAHRLGLGVLLDVVFHCVIGEGNFLDRFARDYFSDRYPSEWGSAINFDGENAEEVRRFVLASVRCWVEEYHIDGFRLDATQGYFDHSPTHILAQISLAARAAAGNRPVVLLAESEPQQTRLIRPVETGGYGMDAAWNDDFHHSARVCMTGFNEAYYTDYRGTPEEFIAVAKRGYLYQGQWYSWQKKSRGTSTKGLPGAAFVNYLQNHDQIANSIRGQRIHQLTSAAKLRAMTTLWLLTPGTPLFFQGQEFAASNPFRYFADDDQPRREQVAASRAKFLSQFPSYATPEAQAALVEPSDVNNFLACKLDWSEREEHRHIVGLHRDLLRLRREDPVFRMQAAERIDGATLGAEALVLRFFGEDAGDRLLLVNFGRDLQLPILPQPLLAPPPEAHWKVLWSSEELDYGGSGNPYRDFRESWSLRGEAATVLTSRPSLP